MGAFPEGLPHYVLTTEFSLKFRETIFPLWIKELPPIFAKYTAILHFPVLIWTRVRVTYKDLEGGDRDLEKGGQAGLGWGGRSGRG